MEKHDLSPCKFIFLVRKNKEFNEKMIEAWTKNEGFPMWWVSKVSIDQFHTKEKEIKLFCEKIYGVYSTLWVWKDV